MDNYLARHTLSNPLTIAFADVFSYIFEFKKHCVTNQPVIDEVSGRLQKILEKSAVYILTQAVDPRDYDDARFAVCAWVDEMILHMPWTYRDSWQRNLLQNKYYATVNAGSEFYDRLNSIDSGNYFVREVYFLCLGLGFKGSHSFDEDTVLLDKIKESILTSLVDETKGLTGSDKHLLFEMAYQTENKAGLCAELKLSGLTKKRYLLVLLIPPLLLVSVYSIYAYFLNDVAKNIMFHVVAGQ